MEEREIERRIERLYEERELRVKKVYAMVK